MSGKLAETRFEPPAESGVEFTDVRADAVDFSRERFYSLTAERATFLRCDFRAAEIEAGNLGDWNTVYRECRFERADLSGARPAYARFERCVFDNANLTGWLSHHAEFVDCHFGGRVERVKFFGAPPRPVKGLPRSRNEFRGNDFSHADLVDTSFTFGIDISGQKWPTNPIYLRLNRAPERLKAVKEAVSHWRDGLEKQSAETWLRVYSGEANRQSELFVRRDDILDEAPELRDRLWAMLEDAL